MYDEVLGRVKNWVYPKCIAIKAITIKENTTVNM